MFSTLVLSTLIAYATAHPNGAGQCTIGADGKINGMNGRGRDGTNTVTVTPTTVAPGGKVTIKVTATEFIGVLGTVYAGTEQVGTHTPPAGTAACMGNANAITHSAPLATTTSLSWEYTVPATATGTLEARVVTLNGAVGGDSAQKFAVGKATITISAGTAPTVATTAGSTTAGATTTGKSAAASLVVSAAAFVAALVATLA